MTSHIEALKEANRQVLAAFDSQDAELAGREKKAHETLSFCETERRRIQERREIILQAQELQIQALSADKAETPDEQAVVTALNRAIAGKLDGHITGTEGRARRARIGPQRYHIMVSLRKNGRASVEDVALATGLPVRRIREQLRSDMTDGYVVEIETYELPRDDPTMYFTLSQAGRDLLTRFEAYREANNKPLPTLEEAVADQTKEDSELGAPSTQSLLA